MILFKKLGEIMNNIIYFTDVKKRFLIQGDDIMCSILQKIKNKTPMELLNEYRIDLVPPIDISLLLEQIGISVISKDFTDVENIGNYPHGSILGAAISKGDDLAIFYRKNDTYNRKIFTVAHELGHCCLHTDDLKISHIEFRTVDTYKDKRERDVNIFAGQLLIPKHVLIPIYNKYILPSLKDLSEIFCVSTNVMAARLDYLRLNYFKDTKISEE